MNELKIDSELLMKMSNKIVGDRFDGASRSKGLKGES